MTGIRSAEQSGRSPPVLAQSSIDELSGSWALRSVARLKWACLTWDIPGSQPCAQASLTERRVPKSWATTLYCIVSECSELNTVDQHKKPALPGCWGGPGESWPPFRTPAVLLHQAQRSVVHRIGYGASIGLAFVLEPRPSGHVHRNLPRLSSKKKVIFQPQSSPSRA